MNYSWAARICQCLRVGSRPNYEMMNYRMPREVAEKTLVIDLDETLVHSSFKHINNADRILEITVMGDKYTVYLRIRPGAQLFILEMAKYFEIILFTASIQEYADPVIDILDPENVISQRLFRENCTHYNGNMTKDLSTLKRDLSQTILIDNAAYSFVFQPKNAIHILDFIDDKEDEELILLMPFLILLSDFQDVRPVHQWLYRYANQDSLTYTCLNGEEKTYASEICDRLQVESPKGESDKLTTEEQTMGEVRQIYNPMINSPIGTREITFPQ